MRGHRVAFFRLKVAIPLIRNGGDFFHPDDPKTGESRHTLISIHVEMLLQICRDYASLPDPRSLTLGEIRFFYDGLRAELRASTKPRG